MSSAEPNSGGRPAPTRRRLWQLLPVDWGRVAEFTNEPVPAHIKRWWFALGGTPAFLFFVQVTTGLLLTFYYVPSPDHAYESVYAITHKIPFGWFVRGIHKWAGNLMIVTVILHMCRVFFTSAYRHPRQLNWLLGLGLLICTLMAGFTGYSLLYEQLSYWGSTVAGNLTKTAPVVGDTLAAFLLGGPEVGSNTLTRLYMLHVALLPIAMVLLIGLHVAMIRIHGISELSFEEEAPSPLKPARRLFGVKWMALLLLAGAVAAGVAAYNNVGPVNLIAHELSPYSTIPLNLAADHPQPSDVWGLVTSARLFWIVLCLALLAGGVLMWLGHWHGLMVYMTLAVLGGARLIHDLLNGTDGNTALWGGILAVLAGGLVYGLWRHRRFQEGAPDTKPFSFFPDHILTEIIIGTLLVFVLTLLVLMFPAELGPKADPNVTPDEIKPEWYFYFQFRLLKLVKLDLSVLLTGLMLAVLFAWPWIDRGLERLFPGRDVSVYIGIMGFLFFLSFTVWEAMARPHVVGS